MPPLSSRHPALYKLSVFLRRLHRRLIWLANHSLYADEKSSDILNTQVATHRSLLLRKLAGTDQTLQKNKVQSLAIAAEQINGVLVKPGKVFSFWKLVGKPTAARGFPPGLQLSFGSLIEREGGGLCQMSNLIHWMVLHTPMTVVERHRHSTDPFPDFRRTVPFGTGATVFYNYLDFAFRNNTPDEFQICVSVGQEHLHGSIRCSTPLKSSFSVEERNHRFVRKASEVYRMNELWRIETDAAQGNVIGEELLMKNCCQVLYEVPDEEIWSQE